MSKGKPKLLEGVLLKNRANIDTGALATGNLTLMTVQGTSMLAV